jgi:hypothetical protein
LKNKCRSPTSDAYRAFHRKMTPVYPADSEFRIGKGKTNLIMTKVRKWLAGAGAVAVLAIILLGAGHFNGNSSPTTQTVMTTQQNAPFGDAVSAINTVTNTGLPDGQYVAVTMNIDRSALNARTLNSDTIGYVDPGGGNFLPASAVFPTDPYDSQNVARVYSDPRSVLRSVLDPNRGFDIDSPKEGSSSAAVSDPSVLLFVVFGLGVLVLGIGGVTAARRSLDPIGYNGGQYSDGDGLYRQNERA